MLHAIQTLKQPLRPHCFDNIFFFYSWDIFFPGDITPSNHGAAGVPAVSLPDVRAGHHVVRPHVLPEVRDGLPAVQMPLVQGEVKTTRGEEHEEQRAAHQRGGEVLPR